MLINLTNKNHGDDFHGGMVSDAEAIEEVGLKPKPSKPVVDLRAAAVDEDGAEADAG